LAGENPRTLSVDLPANSKVKLLKTKTSTSQIAVPMSSTRCQQLYMVSGFYSEKNNKE
jgi:hypothetical protein